MKILPTTTLRKLYRNASLSQKLFLSFSLMIAIPAVLITVLFIRTQEIQVYKDAMAAGDSHVARLDEQLRSRLNIIESVSSTALAQKAFIDFIHSDMREDGLRLVKFRQNEFDYMQKIIQSHGMISSISFYVDNPDLYEIWPEIYHYDRFTPRDFWITLRDAGGAAYRLFTNQEDEDMLTYYRLVRLGGTGQHPSILVIRVAHELLFRDLFDETSGNFFSVVMDGEDPERAIYNPDHEFVQYAGRDLESILSRILPEMDVLQTNSPVKVEVGERTYYALYRYVTPLDAYVVDIASHQALMSGPRNMYVLVAAIACCVLVVMLLLVSQTTRRIFRRLDSVLASMRKVREGDLDARIDTGLAEHESGDEIDEVAISYNDMLDEIKRLMTQVVDKQLVAKNAQLHSLHSQINSHFLYNALESIRMLAEVERQPVIADALVSLGSLMRYSMRWHSDTVALSEELANIRNYIKFMNFMDGEHIVLMEHIPPDLQRYAIPKMCMQPLVENVVLHAAPKGENVHIQITAKVKDGAQLLIEIRDDGVGIEPQMLSELQAVLEGSMDAPIKANQDGLGLENVHKRLQLHYGPGSGLQIDSAAGEYTCVTIRLPWENVNLGGW